MTPPTAPVHAAGPLPVQQRPGRITRSGVVALVAACWAVPYIGSKIHYALQGKLGVFGGPVITAADTARYAGPDAISRAQCGNVAVGVLIAAITLLPLAPFTRRWNRWRRAIGVMLVAALVTVMALLFLTRLISGDGGLLFTLYLFAWSGLLWWTAILSVRRTERSPTRHCSP